MASQLTKAELSLRWRSFFADVERVDRTVAGMNLALVVRIVIAMTGFLVRHPSKWPIGVLGYLVWSAVSYAWVRFWLDGSSGAERAIPAACFGLMGSLALLFRDPSDGWAWFYLPIFATSAWYTACRSTDSLRYS